MRRSVVPILVMLSAGCSAPPPRAVPAAAAPGGAGEKVVVPAEPMSVIEAVRLAMRQNPDILAAAERIAQAEAGLAEVRAAWLPHLLADMSYLRADAPSAYLFKTIDARSLAPGADFNDPGTFGNVELGGTLRWNLFQGGLRHFETKIAETERAVRELDRTALENRLISSTIQGYYDVLAADEFIATAEASVRTVGAQLEDQRKLYEGGATGARKADVLALEVRLAEARERELRARNARSLSAAALNNLMGLEPDVAVALSGDEWRPRPLPEAYEQAVAEALENRSELAAARAAVERADYAHRAEKTTFLPRVDFVGRTYWDDPDARYDGDDTNWTVGVNLVWELFRGGARFARVNRAKAQIAEYRSLDRKAVLAIELDVRTAYLRHEEARARQEVAEKGVVQATQSLDLAQKLYRGGAATVTRYLEAELALTAARVRATQARYDIRKTAADLARAMGWCVQCAREMEVAP